jgi:hypothetical protein
LIFYFIMLESLSMNRERFATILTCMDGRVQKPGAVFMQETTQADYVDTITEPGIVRILNGAQGDTRMVTRMRQQLGISLGNHGSKGVGVVAHEYCAGNDTDNTTQIEQLATACAIVRDLVAEGGFSASVWGIFVTRQTSGLWVAEQKVDPQ